MKYLNLFSTKVILSIFVLFVGLSGHGSVNSLSTLPEHLKNHVVSKFADAKQIACMANNIFYEANGENTKGQIAVARVVMNRIQHGFGANPCKVINQVTKVDNKKVCQFSWVCENKPTPNKNDPRYVKAMDIAYQVLALDMHKDIIPKSVLFFHNTTVQPNWPHRKVMTIGNHVFYSKVYK